MRVAMLACVCTFLLNGCSSPQQVRVLGDDLAPLRSAFNENADQWRTVALVSPTCSECVLGAEVVEKEITRRYPASQVDALVVWIPMLETDSEKAARAASTIFSPDRVTQFYDSRQVLGTLYAQKTFAGFFERARQSLSADHWLAMALDDRIEVRRPQWDLYMLYAPGVSWQGEAPPMPTHWIRHLGRGEDRKTSTYWQDTPESGPREGDLYVAIRSMADNAIGEPHAMKNAMRIEVLGFDGCPNTPATKANVEEAVASLGIDARITYVDQMNLPEGDLRRGWPAPTVLVNGRDLFEMPAPHGSGMGCRTYPNGWPTESEIIAALRLMSDELSATEDLPMVCTLSPEQLSAQRDVLLPGLLKRADERTVLERGYRMKFKPTPGLLDEIAGIVEQERGCCQFLRFQIIVEPSNGPIYLEVTGPPGTREILDSL